VKTIERCLSVESKVSSHIVLIPVEEKKDGVTGDGIEAGFREN
jgi:hypothetical protein